MKVTLADTAIMVEGWRAEYDSLGDYTLRGRKTPEELKQEKEVNRKVAEKYDTKPRKVNPMRFENKTVLIYDEKDRSRVYFLPGLWPSVKGFFDMNKIPYTVEDKRDMSIRPNPDYSVLQGVEFRENQDLALALIASADCGIIETATAWGKCHAPGTPILMYNGKKKPVEDVKAGDQLMGDDSTVRHVLTCTKGRGQMFKVIPKYGKAYKYNKDHILVLKKIDGTIVEISIEDYLKLSEKEQSALYLYRNEVVFAHRKEPEIDPYFIGAHMVAGAYDNRSIYHIPDKVVDYCCKYIKKLKGHYTRHSYAFTYNGDHRLLKKIKEHTKASINSPQHIDNEIKYGSIDVRKQFIAGLVDCSFNDTQNSRDKFEIQAVHYKKVAKEIAFIVNSIGMIAEVEPSGEQYKVIIRGNLYKIPTKDSISNAQEANERIPFTIEEASVDDYYGFTVDVNHRYLLGDFLVTHNSFLI